MRDKLFQPQLSWNKDVLTRPILSAFLNFQELHTSISLLCHIRAQLQQRSYMREIVAPYIVATSERFIA
jgi:hypothetical protein